MSKWLTQKEQSCFDAAGSPLGVSIEAGHIDALVYVLLHEATHVVDDSLHLTTASRPGTRPDRYEPNESFTKRAWNARTIPLPQFRNPLLEHIRFRGGGHVFPIAQAEAVYAALRRTPFVSLYGSSNWHDDLAEYVAVFHFTEVLKQPYRIVIRKSGRDMFVYEPMKSETVRGRCGEMRRFYEKEDQSKARGAQG